MNIDANTYKEYTEKYSSIEIEVIPQNNHHNIFINFNNGDNKYIHIYFDNDKEEVKRNYLNENEEVEKN